MRLRLILLLLTTGGMSFTAVAGGTEPISVVVSAAPSTPLSFNVSVTISNNGDVPVIISRAHLPFNWEVRFQTNSLLSERLTTARFRTLRRMLRST